MSPAPETLADPHQVIADLQRELSDAHERLAERTAERDEALARETATAEVLGVINSSPGDLAPVFEAILEKSHTLCGADHGAMCLHGFSKGRTSTMRRNSCVFSASSFFKASKCCSSAARLASFVRVYSVSR